jgi:hypothetical protein
MHPRLETIRARIAADFPADLSPVELVNDPDFGWSLTFAGRVYGGIDDDDTEHRVAMAADYLQDVVVDETGRTWPQADGRPLFATVDDGQAWWMRDGQRFAPIGHLNQALHRTTAA